MTRRLSGTRRLSAFLTKAIRSPGAPARRPRSRLLLPDDKGWPCLVFGETGEITIQRNGEVGTLVTDDPI